MYHSNIYDAITREQFCKSLTDLPEDKFAKTFVAKADAMKLWDNCWAISDSDGRVMSAIIVTHGKTYPRCANLQLLHTFKEFRGRSLAKFLVLEEFIAAKMCGVDYFRVSAEPDALQFYEKLGFKFQGKQKSGCSLSICRMMSALSSMTAFMPKHCSYSMKDSYIRNKVLSKAKGGCVTLNDWAQAEMNENVFDGFTTEG